MHYYYPELLPFGEDFDQYCLLKRRKSKEFVDTNQHSIQIFDTNVRHQHSIPTFDTSILLLRAY